MEKLNQYIHEISSFEYLKTSEARHRNYYPDNNHEPIELVRLPKYSQLGTYEEIIRNLKNEAYHEIMLLEDFKIIKVLHLLKELESKFKNLYWPFFKKWYNLFTNELDSFAYSDFINNFFYKFSISHTRDAFLLNGQDGGFGRIEADLFSDLSDALMLKQSSIQHIIRQLTDYLESSNSNKTLALNVNQLNRKNSNISNEPKTFNEMFENPNLIEISINVLKQVKPPIINSNNEFNLGSKSKGSIVAWITALKHKGIIKNGLSDSAIALCLNSKFKGLELGKDGRTLRNLNTTSYNKYYTTILNYLPELPLSTTGKNR